MEEEALNIWWLLTCNDQKYKNGTENHDISATHHFGLAISTQKTNAIIHLRAGCLTAIEMLNRYEETLVTIQEAVIADYPSVHWPQTD